MRSNDAGIGETVETKSTEQRIMKKDWRIQIQVEQNSIKKAMISQPMAGKTPEEIVEVRDKAVKHLEGLGYEVIDTYFPNDFKGLTTDIHNKPLFFLGQSLMCMSYCDAVYFCNGWDKTRGCILEHKAAEVYGLELLYE